MARQFEKRYRLSESDDVLEKMSAILRDLDQRMDAVELVKEAFQQGNRLDVDALLKAITEDISGKSAAMQLVLEEVAAGFTADRVLETAERRFTSDAEQQTHIDALTEANTRISARATSAALGAHTGRTDNPHSVTAAQVGALTAAQTDADLDMLEALLLGTASSQGDTLGKLEAAIGKRVRVDADQILSQAEKGRALANIGAGVLSGFRNKLINGDFDIWQRGASQTVNGFSADRWFHGHNAGATKTVTRQESILGQTAVPGNPRYYMQTVIAASAGVNNYVTLHQKVAGVRSSSGKKMTLTFWARATVAGKSLAVDGTQHFGSGADVPPEVTGISPKKFALATSWQKFAHVMDFPSISGKTLSAADNDFYRIVLWLSAGGSYDARTEALGLQTGTFQIAHVSLVEGDATAEADPFEPRHLQQETALCTWFFERMGEGAYLGSGWCDGTTTFRALVNFLPKRSPPAFSLSGNGIQVGVTGADPQAVDIDISFTHRGGNAARMNVINTPFPAKGEGGDIYLRTGSTAYLDIDAEI